MTLARTTISIEKTTLDRFFHAYPAGKRSQVIQKLIETNLDDRNAHLARMASFVESDPAFLTMHDDMALWERTTAGDGLAET